MLAARITSVGFKHDLQIVAVIQGIGHECLSLSAFDQSGARQKCEREHRGSIEAVQGVQGDPREHLLVPVSEVSGFRILQRSQECPVCLCHSQRGPHNL